MPEAVIHPTPQELTAFGLGKLPEHAAAVVQEAGGEPGSAGRRRCRLEADELFQQPIRLRSRYPLSGTTPSRQKGFAECLQIWALGCQQDELTQFLLVKDFPKWHRLATNCCSTTDSNMSCFLKRFQSSHRPPYS